MSYTNEVMENLAIALRNTDGLKMELKRFNKNIESIDRLSAAIERQNELKEIELGIKPKTYIKREK